MLTPHILSASTPPPLQHRCGYKRQLCHPPLNDGMMEAIDRRLQRERLIRQLPDSVEYIRNTPQHTTACCNPYWASIFLLWSQLRGRMNFAQNTCTGSVGKCKLKSNNSTVHLPAVRAYGNKKFVLLYWAQFIVLFPVFSFFSLPKWDEWCSRGFSNSTN